MIWHAHYTQSYKIRVFWHEGGLHSIEIVDTFSCWNAGISRLISLMLAIAKTDNQKYSRTSRFESVLASKSPHWQTPKADNAVPFRHLPYIIYMYRKMLNKMNMWCAQINSIDSIQQAFLFTQEHHFITVAVAKETLGTSLVEITNLAWPKWSQKLLKITRAKYSNNKYRTTHGFCESEPVRIWITPAIACVSAKHDF